MGKLENIKTTKKKGFVQKPGGEAPHSKQRMNLKRGKVVVWPTQERKDKEKEGCRGEAPEGTGAGGGKPQKSSYFHCNCGGTIEKKGENKTPIKKEEEPETPYGTPKETGDPAGRFAKAKTESKEIDNRDASRPKEGGRVL